MVATMFVTSSAAFASQCEIRRDCTANTACETETLTLEWPSAAPNTLQFDGKAFHFVKINEGDVLGEIKAGDNTVTLRTGEPLLVAQFEDLFAYIGGGSGDEITIVLLRHNVPPSVVREVYTGTCEGLF